MTYDTPTRPITTCQEAETAYIDRLDHLVVKHFRPNLMVLFGLCNSMRGVPRAHNPLLIIA